MMRIACFLLFLGLSVSAAFAQQPMAAVPALASPMRSYALRLRPGEDLRQQLTAFTQEHHLKAAAIVTCVGSLTTTTLRLANQSGPTVYKGHFEIVSLVGTLSVNGSHLHLAVSDSTGRTVGGHLLDGNIVYTTAELVIGVLEELDFRRELDPVSTYNELSIYPLAPAKPKKSKAAQPKKAAGKQ